MESTNIVQPNKTSTIWRWLLILVIVVFSVLVIVVGTAAAMAYSNNNKIYSGVKVDDINLGGLTKTQATNVLSGKFKTSFSKGFTFKTDNQEKTITNENEEIFDLNLESVIDKAYAYGRENTWWRNYIQILSAPILVKKIDLDYSFDKALLKEKLETEFASLEKPSKDADIILNITDEKTKAYELSFSPSTTGGLTFNYNEAIENLEKNLKNLNNGPVLLPNKNDKPRITTEQAEALREAVIKLLALENIKFTHEDETWEIKWEDFSHWLKLGLNDNEAPSVILNKEMVSGQLESMSQSINQKPVDAKLQIKDGRVAEFQASQNGQTLNIEKSLQKISEEIITNNNPTISLIVEITEPEITMDSTNDLGIKERIGYGISDFSGSPANRRHNIGIGAASMHGVIVAPGDSFSLVKNLGSVDGSNGYKPELVIKGNETIPEYGGGLCQVATTMFRAALDSGLKITQRRNHSYRVSYYEPAGTDATVYIPQPDVRFQNDTEHHVLIQTKLWGDNLQFEIWGTDDGRETIFEGQETVTSMKDLKPKIFNVTSPGPAKEIETTELEPGQRKRTESAHNGADTTFDRIVKFADGTEEKETWSSHYVPWQAVYLVGIDPEAKEKEAQEILEQQELEKAEAAEPEVLDPENLFPADTEPDTTTPLITTE